MISRGSPHLSAPLVCFDKLWSILIEINSGDEIISVVFCSEAKVVLFPVCQTLTLDPDCQDGQLNYLQVSR